jgi:hypothetical protein
MHKQLIELVGIRITPNQIKIQQRSWEKMITFIACLATYIQPTKKCART